MKIRLASSASTLLMAASALSANAAPAPMGPPRSFTDPSRLVPTEKPEAGPVSLTDRAYVRRGWTGSGRGTARILWSRPA
jgi:hypothetical protein